MDSPIPIPETPPRHATVVDWLASGVESFPDATALGFRGSTISYRDLDSFGNRVANHLVASGVEPGDRVGLCLDRSIEMVAALVGILKAGAAYVPLDPAYPVDRLGMMSEDAGLRCLFSHGAHAHLFPDALVWENISGEVEIQSPEPPDIAVDPESPAYVIFTSGSTGRPKGIAMPHRALANLIEWQLERKTFRPGARVLQYSSISFDVSFQEIATTLASGGTLHLISDADRRDPRLLLAQLVEQKIARLFLPYVAMRSMIEAAHVVGSYPEDLKEIITAGEQLRVDDTVRSFFARIGGATLDNQYGPSETHVVTAHLLEGDPAAWPELPPIGTPLKNCGTFILDEEMRPVPNGEEGELYLAGRNLALGYIGRDDLTRAAFLELPSFPRLYKTGDLAKYNADGSIDFLGRRDHQLKVLGHRVEPGEINNAASQLPGIGQCLTHAFRSPAGVLQLATYYTLKEGASVSYENLREHLDAKLPDYMVPAFLIELDEIPYTPSGKVDLKALPTPSIANSRYAGEEIRYESETEEKLSKVWNELLGMDGIPRSADFFELGGDSLRAVTLFLKIQQLFGRDLPLATLTHTSTISGLAKLIDGDGEADGLSGFRSLQMLQPGDPGRVPFFLVHGGQGNVLVFSKLVKMLDPGQPVFAFQWPGWDGYPGSSDVDELARDYCEELVRFRPTGDFRLGGYCIGGLLAIAMARRLETMGRKILDPLVVWDAPNLKSSRYRREEPWDSAGTIADFNRMKERLKATRIQTTVDDAGVPKSDFAPPSGKGALIRKIPGLMPLLRLGKAMEKRRREAPRRRETAGYLKRGEALPMELRAEYCLDCMVRAARHHRSEGYGGDILYFRSDCVVSQYFGLNGWWDDIHLGFAELCMGDFEAYAVGGGHTDVVEIPEMAEIIRQKFQSLDGS